MTNKWYGVNTKDADKAIAGALQEVKDITDPVFDVLLTSLTLAQQALRFLITLLNAIELPIIQLLDEIIQSLESLKRDLANAGVYFTWDKEILKVFEDPYLLKGGYKAFEQRMVKKLTNISDPTRPDFSRYSKVVALVAHAGGPVSATADIVKALKSFIDLFTGGGGSEDSLPRPSNVEVGYFKEYDSGIVSNLEPQDIDKDNIPSGIRVKWNIFGRQNPKDFFPSFVIPPPYFWVIVSTRPKVIEGVKRFRVKDFVSDEDRGKVVVSKVPIGDSKSYLQSDMIGLIKNPDADDFKRPESFTFKGSKMVRFEDAQTRLSLEQAQEEVEIFLVESSNLGAFFGSNEYDLYISKEEIPRSLYVDAGGDLSPKEVTEVYVSVVSALTDEKPFVLEDYKEVYGQLKVASAVSSFSERVRAPKISLSTDDITSLDVMRDCLTLFCLGRFDIGAYSEEEDESNAAQSTEIEPFNTVELTLFLERAGSEPLVIPLTTAVEMRTVYAGYLSEEVENARVRLATDYAQELTSLGFDNPELKGIALGLVLEDFDATEGPDLNPKGSRKTDYTVGNPLAQLTRDNVLSYMSVTGSADLTFMDEEKDPKAVNRKIATLAMNAIKRVYVYGRPDQNTLNALKDDIQKLTEFFLETTSGVGLFNLLDKYEDGNPISSTGVFPWKRAQGQDFDFNGVELIGEEYAPAQSGPQSINPEKINIGAPLDRPVLIKSDVLSTLIELENNGQDPVLKRSSKYITYAEFEDLLIEDLKSKGFDVDNYGYNPVREKTRYEAELKSQGYVIGSWSDLQYPQEIKSVPVNGPYNEIDPVYVNTVKDFRALAKEAEILDSFTNIMQTVFRGKKEIKGEWQFFRLFENGVPEVDVFLDEMIKFMRSTKATFKSIIEGAEKYINTLNKRILEIQRVVYMLKRVIDSILAFKISGSLDLLWVDGANGTQGLVEELRQAQDKPLSPDISAGAMLVAGGLPNIVIDFIQAVANPKDTFEAVNENLNDFADGLNKSADPLA